MQLKALWWWLVEIFIGRVLEAPRNVPVASIEVGAVEIVEGRIKVHLRVRPTR